MMTKKDYELIAHTLSDARNVESESGKAVVDSVAERFASYLLCTNPRFDRERFLRACQPESGRSGR